MSNGIAVGITIVVFGIVVLCYSLTSRSEAVGFIGTPIGALIILTGLIAIGVSLWW